MSGRAAAVAGMGSALPERVVTNDELSRTVDTTDEWIRDRTGIRARRFAAPDETAASLAAEAASRALKSAGLGADEIELTVVATVTGDQPMPATAVFVQDLLGARGAAFDLQAACAGFVYGMDLAAAQVERGRLDTALVIGTEVLSRFLDMSDRTTCVLFGDGAGAAVLRPAKDPGFLGSVLEADGRTAKLLEIPAGGSRRPASGDTVAERGHLIKMADGRDVFRRAVVGMADACRRLLDRAGCSVDDVSLVVPHQANARIIRAVTERLHVDPSRVYVDLEDVGNTSAASVPIALDHAWRDGRLGPGDLVLTTAFGAGLAWGANLLRWTAEMPA